VCTNNNDWFRRATFVQSKAVSSLVDLRVCEATFIKLAAQILSTILFAERRRGDRTDGNLLGGYAVSF
jgi:hypothetical protein